MASRAHLSSHLHLVSGHRASPGRNLRPAHRPRLRNFRAAVDGMEQLGRGPVKKPAALATGIHAAAAAAVLDHPALAAKMVALVLAVHHPRHRFRRLHLANVDRPHVQSLFPAAEE